MRIHRLTVVLATEDDVDSNAVEDAIARTLTDYGMYQIRLDKMRLVRDSHEHEEIGPWDIRAAAEVERGV
jgi:uncharacterized protein YheU (UPF0270 family)